MKRSMPPLTCLLAASALSACSSTDKQYPSLAIRDVEQQATAPTPAETGTPARVTIPMQAPPSFDRTRLARTGSLLGAARSAHARFRAATAAAERAVAAGGRASIDSEAKAMALVELANLDSLRSQTAVPLGDLDKLYADAAAARALEGSLVNARREVISMISAQDATIRRLRSRTSL